MSNITHIKVNGSVYFITSCIEQRAKILGDYRLAQEVMDSILFCREKRLYYLIAFTIMPNHFHLEILPRSRSVPQIMRSLKGYTAKRMNAIMNKKGKIWQDGYIDFPMDDIDAIITKKNYIEMNPVRANLVENQFDYPFSSAGKDDLYDLSCLFK